MYIFKKEQLPENLRRTVKASEKIAGHCSWLSLDINCQGRLTLVYSHALSEEAIKKIMALFISLTTDEEIDPDSISCTEDVDYFYGYQDTYTLIYTPSDYNFSKL